MIKLAIAASSELVAIDDNGRLLMFDADHSAKDHQIPPEHSIELGGPIDRQFYTISLHKGRLGADQQAASADIDGLTKPGRKYDLLWSEHLVMDLHRDREPSRSTAFTSAFRLP